MTSGAGSIPTVPILCRASSKHAGYMPGAASLAGRGPGSQAALALASASSYPGRRPPASPDQAGPVSRPCSLELRSRPVKMSTLSPEFSIISAQRPCGGSLLEEQVSSRQGGCPSFTEHLLRLPCALQP